MSAHVGSTLEEAVATAMTATGGPVDIERVERTSAGVRIETRPLATAMPAGWRAAALGVAGTGAHRPPRHAGSGSASALADRLGRSGAPVEWADRLAEILTQAPDGHARRNGLALFLAARVRFGAPPDLLPGNAGVILVGPIGAGKTTLACRIAQRIAPTPARKVRLVQADRRSIASGAVLATFARHTGTPCVTAGPAWPLRQEPGTFAIVDTAGLRSDERELDAITALRAGLGRVATVLVLPATTARARLAGALEQGRALGATAAALTHVDEGDTALAALAQVAAAALPLVYLGDGYDLSRAATAASAAVLADLVAPDGTSA